MTCGTDKVGQRPSAPTAPSAGLKYQGFGAGDGADEADTGRSSTLCSRDAGWSGGRLVDAKFSRTARNQIYDLERETRFQWSCGRCGRQFPYSLGEQALAVTTNLQSHWRSCEGVNKKGTHYLAGRLELANIVIFKSKEISEQGQPIGSHEAVGARAKAQGPGWSPEGATGNSAARGPRSDRAGNKSRRSSAIGAHL